MAVIVIKRKSSLLGCAQRHDVYLSNTLVGELKSGGTLEFQVDVGSHQLFFRSRMKRAGENATFIVNVNEEDEVVELKTKFNMSGKYVVEYADNKPHVLTAENAATDLGSASLAQEQVGLCCPRCGSHEVTPISEVSTKGKDFNAGNACCGLLLLGPLGLLCGATGKGKQTTTTVYWICKVCGNKFKK